MLISELRSFIRVQGSVSMTELKLKFDLEAEDLQLPLKLLIDKGYIEKQIPIADKSSSLNCKGCPMGCASEKRSNCSPAPDFTIYCWKKV